MKRVLTFFMILGLVAGSVATADAKKPRQRVERTVEGEYGPYPAPVTNCSEPLGAWACMEISTGPKDRFFTAKVADAHGQPVFVQATNGAGHTIATFCGDASTPVAIEPGAGLRFYVSGVPFLFADLFLDCPANRIKTTGTISVTLSNLP